MTSVYNHAGERRRTSAEGPEWFQVTGRSHPSLHEAFAVISHDGGWGAGHARFSVPRVWEPQLAEIEQALSTLSVEDFLEFCTGEAGESEKISRRSPALTKTHELLEAFFEDWHEYERRHPTLLHRVERAIADALTPHPERYQGSVLAAAETVAPTQAAAIEAARVSTKREEEP